MNVEEKVSFNLINKYTLNLKEVKMIEEDQDQMAYFLADNETDYVNKTSKLKNGNLLIDFEDESGAGE